MWSFISACLLGLVAGGVGRLLVRGPTVTGCLPTMAVGLAGSLVGWGFFRLLDIGDTDKFDWGGILGAIFGSAVLLSLWAAFTRSRGRRPGPRG